MKKNFQGYAGAWADALGSKSSTAGAFGPALGGTLAPLFYALTVRRPGSFIQRIKEGFGCIPNGCFRALTITIVSDAFGAPPAGLVIDPPASLT